jgi:predicted nucleic acid-binding protein
VISYALDTNIVSYYLKKDRHIMNTVSDIIKSGSEIIIPPMVYYEIKRGLICRQKGN